MRLCFCQPYDGVGKRAHGIPAKALCLSRGTSIHNTDKKEHSIPVKASEADLPAARVIDSGNSRKRKEGVSDASKHGRTRSDSAVSVGVSLRVAIAGG